MRIVAEVFGLLGIVVLVLALAPPASKVLIVIFSKYFSIFLPKEKSDKTD